MNVWWARHGLSLLGLALVATAASLNLPIGVAAVIWTYFGYHALLSTAIAWVMRNEVGRTRIAHVIPPSLVLAGVVGWRFSDRRNTEAQWAASAEAAARAAQECVEVQSVRYEEQGGNGVLHLGVHAAEHPPTDVRAVGHRPGGDDAVLMGRSDLRLEKGAATEVTVPVERQRAGRVEWTIELSCGGVLVVYRTAESGGIPERASPGRVERVLVWTDSSAVSTGHPLYVWGQEGAWRFALLGPDSAHWEDWRIQKEGKELSGLPSALAALPPGAHVENWPWQRDDRPLPPEVEQALVDWRANSAVINENPE